jgi:(p)ppGpp synthase/HD superfamily hydrolase
MVSSLTESAALIAALAHKEQKRKDDGSPYVVHPFMVALMLARRGWSENAVSAALVHDVLEDTDYPEEELREKMGPDVMRIVDAVTNDDSLSWEEKKKKYIESVRAGSDEAKAVATADKIHNAESLIAAHAKQGPALWSHFNAGREKKLWFENAMLLMLEESWSDSLIAEYRALVEKLNALD